MISVGWVIFIGICWIFIIGISYLSFKDPGTPVVEELLNLPVDTKAKEAVVVINKNKELSEKLRDKGLNKIFKVGYNSYVSISYHDYSSNSVYRAMGIPSSSYAIWNVYFYFFDHNLKETRTKACVDSGVRFFNKDIEEMTFTDITKEEVENILNSPIVDPDMLQDSRAKFTEAQRLERRNQHKEFLDTVLLENKKDLELDPKDTIIVNSQESFDMYCLQRKQRYREIKPYFENSRTYKEFKTYLYNYFQKLEEK